MNNIGYGIFCFGEEYYYKGTIDKVNKLLANDIHCYVLTDNPEYFDNMFGDMYFHIIPYTRSIKSYHDKMILPKIILKKHDFCVLIDADTHITDFSFIDKLKTYEFKYGISYVDTLLSHKAKREFAKEIVTDSPEWNSYKLYVEKIYPSYGELSTIWEYFLVINKIGFNQNIFYQIYEKLQLTKDFSDLPMNKKISGAGEGISIAISAKLSGSDIQRDMDLYNLLDNKMISVSRRYTPPHLWPNWMK